MSDVRARIANALAAHASGEDGCICGEDDHLAFDYWARHVADVLLSLPGIAVVELPEPEPESQQWCNDAWFVDVDGDIDSTRPIWASMMRSRLSASGARRFATALLAAANAAEATA
jgi:hypothetical protein